MSYILILFCLLCLYGTKFTANNDKYVSRAQTQQINGFFVFLILMSHFVTYVDTSGQAHSFYLEIRGFLRQMVVVSFLFFSGYGMFESYKIKGEKYIKTIPNRFLKLLLRFDIAVALFLIVVLSLGQTFELKRILLAFTAWESIGNSNWYVFVILALYALMYIIFSILKNRPFLSVMGFTAASVLLIVFFLKIGKDTAWYTTILSFTAGIWFSYLKPVFDKITDYNAMTYVACLVLAFIGFMFFHKYLLTNLAAYELTGVFFCLTIVLVSKKVIINNPMLKWLGNHVFSVYILQRIPMIIGQHFGLNKHVYIYFFVSLVCTMVLAYWFDLLTNKLENKLFK